MNHLLWKKKCRITNLINNLRIILEIHLEKQLLHNSEYYNVCFISPLMKKKGDKATIYPPIFLLFVILLQPDERIAVPVIIMSIFLIVIIIMLPYFDTTTLVDITIRTAIRRRSSFASKSNIITIIDYHLSLTATASTDNSSISAALHTHLINITTIIWIIDRYLTIAFTTRTNNSTMSLTGGTSFNTLGNHNNRHDRHHHNEHNLFHSRIP